MSRLPRLTPERMDDAQREAFEELRARRSRVPREGPHAEVYAARDGAGSDGVPSGPFNAWLHSPEIGRTLIRLGGYLRFRSSIPPRLTELAILASARKWTAQFEWYAHARFARRAGVPDEVIEAIRRRERPAFERADDEAVYAFATELLDTHGAGDAAYREVRKHLGERGVVELVALLGYYGLVSMTLNAFQEPLPDGVEPPLA